MDISKRLWMLLKNQHKNQKLRSLQIDNRVISLNRTNKMRYSS
jgi:hypothetical protein